MCDEVGSWVMQLDVELIVWPGVSLVMHSALEMCGAEGEAGCACSAFGCVSNWARSWVVHVGFRAAGCIIGCVLAVPLCVSVCSWVRSWVR